MTTPNWEVPGARPAEGWPGEAGPPQPFGYGPYDGPPGFGPPPAGPRRTNGLAVAALVLGILPTALLAVLFGVLGLRGVRRRGERGQGMAVAGIVLGSLWTVLYVLGALAADLDTDAASGTGRRDIGSLQVGECTSDARPDGVLLNAVTVVACERPHRNEVYAVIDLPAGRYPGDTAVRSQAEQRCGDALQPLVADTTLPEDSGMIYYRPSSHGWGLGERRVTCLLSFGQDRTGRALTVG